MREGRIQSAIADIFAINPRARFSVRQLAERIYPGEEITRSHTNAVGVTLRRTAPTLGLHRSRAQLTGGFGWHHVWGKAR